MKLNFGPVRSFQLRVNDATAFDGGTYTIAEAAIVDELSNDEQYTTSVGVTWRKDEMSDQAKADRDELLKAHKVSAEALAQVKDKHIIRNIANGDTQAIDELTKESKQMAVTA